VADVSSLLGVQVTWAAAGARPDAADRLLKREVSRFIGCAEAGIELGRLCSTCGSSEHGRPHVVRRGRKRPPYVSLSRADGLVIVAVSKANPVGVDIEPIDGARFSGFADVALHPAERPSTVDQQAVVWVRKESLLKATGDGLRADPRSIRLSDAGEPPRLLEWAGRSDVPSVQLRDLEIVGYAACVSIVTDVEVPVTTRRAAPAELSG